MKKQIFGAVIVLIILVGCSLNRNGISTNTIYKTKNDKVVVTGTVYSKDKNNIRLPGVAIKSADTTLLAITDRDGKYKVEVAAGKNIIRASYIGHSMASTKSLKLAKGDSVVVDFVLKESYEKTIN